MRITCIFRNHPTVIPYITALFGHYIIEVYSHCIGFFDSPHGISAPGHIYPSLVFSHHLFTKICFPAGNVRFHRFQIFLHNSHCLRRIIVHQLLYGHLSFGQFFGMRVDDRCPVCIAIGIFHQYFTGKLLIPKASPGIYILLRHESLIIKDSCRPPHVAHSIMIGRASRLTQFINLLTDIRRHIIHIIGRMGKNSIDGQQQILFQHTFDNVFRRTNHIKILMSLFNLGKHDFVDIECLIDNTDIFSGLFLVINLKIFQNTLTDIISPIVYLQYILARLPGIVTTGKKNS